MKTKGKRKEKHRALLNVWLIYSRFLATLAVFITTWIKDFSTSLCLYVYPFFEAVYASPNLLVTLEDTMHASNNQNNRLGNLVPRVFEPSPQP
jgi:hypothetical protein